MPQRTSGNLSYAGVADAGAVGLGRSEPIVELDYLHHPSHRRGWHLSRLRLRSAASLVLALTVVAAVACGDPQQATERVTASDSALDAASESSVAGLPALPPNEERHPELYDEEGCLDAGPTDSQCETTAAGVDVGELGQGEESWRTLAGFMGPRYASSVSGGDPIILSDTVSVSDSGQWAAWGLFRNESAAVLEHPRVRAELVDSSGVVLETVESEALLPSVRPGEPAPFHLISAVDVADVADARMLVQGGRDPVEGESAEAVGSTEGSRDMELAIWWTRGFSDPDPLDSYLHRDDAGANDSVTFGSATNVGATAISDPTMVGAWIDGDGRVLWVATAGTVDPVDGAALDSVDSAVTLDEPDARIEAEPTAEPGDSTDFVFVIRAGTAPTQLDGATIALWGYGR